MKNLGQMIRFHRKKSGLTMKQLAEYAGIGKTVIFDIEHNKTSVRLDTLEKLCQVLNITIRFDSPLMKEYAEGANEKS